MTHADCPLAAVDRRLQDVHDIWHQAEAAYFEPEAFRRASQNAIQMLRTVTFILQNHKRLIPDFEVWYSSRQELLRADPLMRWMVDARNTIEKRGDLEVHSVVRAEIICSYLDDGPVIELPASLSDTTKLLFERIPRGQLGEHVLKTGTLRIQRRWVENSLPTHELLEAIAQAYGKISGLVHDAHRQIGLPPPASIHVDGSAHTDNELLSGKLPCMIGHASPRTISISLSNSAPLDLKRVSIKYDEQEFDKLSRKYGVTRGEFAKSFATERELARAWFETARRVFLADGFHGNVFYLLHNQTIRQLLPWVSEDQGQKYLIMRWMADEVVRAGADAVMNIGEVWTAPIDKTVPYRMAAEFEGRGEALLLQVATKTGQSFQLMALIRRTDGELALGETVESEGRPFIFAPIYKIWGLSVPDKWLQELDEARGIDHNE